MSVPSVFCEEIRSIGHIVRVHGLRCEWRVRLSEEIPVKTLWCRKSKGEEWRSYQIEKLRPFGAAGNAIRRGWSDWLLKVKEIDCLEDARSWIGADVGIALKDLKTLPKGEYYSEDLLGCRVWLASKGTEKPTFLGEVTEVIPTASNDVLRVKEDVGKFHLIPFTDEVIRSVRLEDKVLEISPLPGLLLLN